MVSLAKLRSEFHFDICDALLVLDQGVASNADGGQRTSIQIANHIAHALGAKSGKKLAGQTAGQRFEKAVESLLSKCFLQTQTLRPGQWKTEAVNSRNELIIARFEQYSHLKEVKRISDENPDLAVFVGHDYSVAPDVVISRLPIDDADFAASGLELSEKVGSRSPLRKANNELPLMHASVSCKWTIRSDRAQNSRFEALNLIRSRKGRVPHIVVVTGEPTPSRLASLALGTGDLDCVYHFALFELIAAVEATGQDETLSILKLMVDGNRLRDISDLPLDLLA